MSMTKTRWQAQRGGAAIPMGQKVVTQIRQILVTCKLRDCSDGTVIALTPWTAPFVFLESACTRTKG